jgi:hypothetical protein
LPFSQAIRKILEKYFPRNLHFIYQWDSTINNRDDSFEHTSLERFGIPPAMFTKEGNETNTITPSPHNVDYDSASQEMEQILNATRPKHLMDGIWTGAEEIVGGGIGAVGIALLTPVHGATIGASSPYGKVVGGTLGAIGGTVVGLVQAANVAGGGKSTSYKSIPTSW